MKKKNTNKVIALAKLYLLLLAITHLHVDGILQSMQFPNESFLNDDDDDDSSSIELIFVLH